MTITASPTGRDPEAASMSAARAASIRYGTRLAAAVLLAFGASAALRLPEGFWAVMSALIVVRPSTGSTLSAGWDRVRGAAAGTVLGLAGVGLRHAMRGSDIASSIAPLVLVTALAFGAGLTPALRSAPISALIVVTSGGIPGHSAGQVALLRALEIGIGVGAALLVALADAKSRATRRFRVAMAEQLRAMAATLGSADLSVDPSVDPSAAPDRAAEARAAEARRAAIRELVGLAGSADRETRLLRVRLLRPRRWTTPPADGERHRKSALLVARTNNDVALFARARQLAATSDAGSPGWSAEQRAAARLIAIAEALETGRPIAPAPKQASSGKDDDRAASGEPERRNGDPLSFVLALLDDDLRGLARLEGLHAAAVP